MKKVLMVLALVVGFLVPVFLAPPPASAVTCGDLIQRDGDVANYNVPVGQTSHKTGSHYGRVFFKWCYPASGPRFAKITGYNVVNNQDDDACANMDDFHYDPNAIGWWNPEPRKSIPCISSGGVGFLSWQCCGSASATSVNVYATDPANERCIAAEAVAGIAPGNDFAITDVPTICFLD